MLNRYLVQMRNAAQRWFKFDNVGQSPQRISRHAMASDGTHIFVLGGVSVGASEDQISFIYVFDTSMYFRFVTSSGQHQRFRTYTIACKAKIMYARRKSRASIALPGVTLHVVSRVAAIRFEQRGVKVLYTRRTETDFF